jgi:hypothetical protein
VSKYHFKFYNNDEIVKAIKAYFFVALRQRVSEEWDIQAYSDFVDNFYQSRFSESFELRAQEMCQRITRLHMVGQDFALPHIDKYVDAELEKHLEFFLVANCKHLLPVELPQGILRHTEARLQNVNLQQLIQDYLDLSKESERYYTDTTHIPAKKMENALTSFLHCEPDETILLISDQTLLGSFKEGFAFTEHGFYWKATMSKPAKVFYGDIISLERDKQKLLINGNYFNISLPINVKMMILLKKMRQLFA